MTLSTDLVIVDPINPKAVFDFALALVADGFRGEPKWDRTPAGVRVDAHYATIMGQGLPAWLFVHYASDGPLKMLSDKDAAEWGDEPPPCNEHCVRIDWDTSYGYVGKNGENCGDLHARYVAAVGRWLDEQGKTWWWHHETLGEWHRGAEGLDTLGDSGHEA